jgi:hypothetical protein
MVGQNGGFVQKLHFVVKTLLYGWLVALRELIRRVLELCRRRMRREADECDRRAVRARCVPIRNSAFVRPDPLIYSQYYLTGLGLAVTWDNPDIQLRCNGVPVSSSLPRAPDTADVSLSRAHEAILGVARVGTVEGR